MGQWRFDFRVDVKRVSERYDVYERGTATADDANAILRTVSKVELRPIRALYEDGCVKMSFIIAAGSQSELHAHQCRIHDSLSKAIEEAKLEKKYAIEFDAPQEVEAGAKGP